ncbi:hypothetical protein DFJ73DRAFT_781819 [Zopfochytrium polystomum]|nr:hypothetical protein DFJ73DRAFT_781819 [Zopfochytrium polystomum]
MTIASATIFYSLPATASSSSSSSSCLSSTRESSSPSPSTAIPASLLTPTSSAFPLPDAHDAASAAEQPQPDSVPLVVSIARRSPFPPESPAATTAATTAASVTYAAVAS